jgi:hypothetical protein
MKSFSEGLFTKRSQGEWAGFPWCHPSSLYHFWASHLGTQKTVAAKLPRMRCSLLRVLCYFSAESC